MKIITILLYAVFITSANASYYNRYDYDSDQAEIDAIYHEMHRQTRERLEDNRHRMHELCIQRKNFLISVGDSLIGLAC